ncbi:hypothetical protein PIB30_021518 [Stylosanthes scabra]|uniref:Uncharacterized protein n=1 Tax=Stylosanthes scabra TaxID=79078 RepID=A0ABU6Q8N6_9FABA|nr:hypothetical protein [Stylosanthes scabra]
MAVMDFSLQSVSPFTITRILTSIKHIKPPLTMVPSSFDYGSFIFVDSCGLIPLESTFKLHLNHLCRGDSRRQHEHPIPLVFGDFSILVDHLSEDPEQISQECYNVGVKPPYDDPMNPSFEPCPLNSVIEEVPNHSHISKDEIPRTCMCFDSLEEAHDFYKNHAEKVGFVQGIDQQGNGKVIGLALGKLNNF